jgi:hypothetical protein
MTICDVTILGAGPYGLSAGAHLSAIKGLDVRVFGEPMEFWKSHMPAGMFLRSPWPASNLSDPKGMLKIDDFGASQRARVPVPIPLSRFVDYGLWFQQKAVPQLDRRRINRIERDSRGFKLTLENQEVMYSRRVVIAGGIGSFARRPDVFAGLSPRLVSHCSDHGDVARFQGKRVVVVGAGQSALESAALIHETGGSVEVLMRESRIRWLGQSSKKLQALGPIGQVLQRPARALSLLLNSPMGVGPTGISRIVALPHSMRFFPRSIQDELRVRSLRASASGNLIERTKDIKITMGGRVASARQNDEGLKLLLEDGSERRVDHVLLGTGYKVDVARYPFLSYELIQALKITDGFPRLKPGLESSIPGLHFIGAPAAWTFGPLMYFVAGTEFAASNLARHIAKNVKTR